MRIIAGSKKGMKLLSPKTRTSRPIIDRVKESLFSVLYKYDLPCGAIVADLFSGVGSLGLETLSRGARFVTFVEQNPEIISVLKRNVEKADFLNESEIIRANAFDFGGSSRDTGVPPVNTAHRTAPLYDLVFVDPPYAETRDVRAGSPLGGLLDSLGGRMTSNAFVVVRTERKVSLLEQYGDFHITERRCWAAMAVTILRKAG
jgi:16S rRNA (guanine966-N2)-methyltransferase